MSLVKVIKKGDELPALDVELSYRDPDLSLDVAPGTTCVFSMTPVGGSTPKIDRQAATVVSSTAGVVLCRYQWKTGDTDTPGDYNGEFSLTLTGREMTAPTSGYLTIRVEPELA